MVDDLNCVDMIDYSLVAGTPIIPFQIELDRQASVLDPEAGQNRKFCYNIKGVGQDNNKYRDLSHFLLGICDEITLDQITNVTVKRNGDDETVIIGENVELKTPNNPDNPTGCSGLKFDFGLNKVNGTMTVCFELTTPYSIGPIDTCLFGGGRTVSGLEVCGPVCGESPDAPCEPVINRSIDVCVPVTIKPYARSGCITVDCIDEPVINSGACECDGEENGSCSFTVTQRLRVRIPLKFGACTHVGNPHVDCTVDPSEDEGCSDCGSKKIEDAVARIQEKVEKKNRFFLS